MFQTLNNDFQILEELGRGRFGTIFRCFSPLSGEFFACKTISKTHLIDSIDQECLDKEPKILNLLSNHPNLTHLHKVYEDDKYLHIIMDLCSGEDLFDRISRSGFFSEREAAPVFTQLIGAIAHCHRMGVAHRDIKPDNVLFDSWGRLKLADFGSAEWFGDGDEGVKMSGIVGTPYYVAPEVLMGREYSEKVDVWSAGVILYIMLSGVPPFYGESGGEIFEAVVRGNLRFPTKHFRAVSTQAKDLLRKMICKDVNRRLSAEQVLRHPWVINGGEMGEET
ncbi:non-receptor serine/threonine protein kinase [Lithospermum erythrorhizon]|uniref:Non-receptor serine/threonine protein kinase n=1 Tax=Lithospermum erythrorhizon TaxID=34254 RepID=A0AAV3Q1R7_LITER